MGLRINTNVASLNAQRNLSNTSKALGRSLERLSSGSRINRAGDDAAGLAISEGLSAQVRGLRQAVRNANDSLGFLNTAEGALAEITNITQRFRELAIQAANGAIGNRERGFLNDELGALLEEFNRIATQTEFNGTKLLDGSFQETDLQVGVNKGETISFTIGDARSSSLGALAVVSGAQGALADFASNDDFSIGAGDTAGTVAITSEDDEFSNFGNEYSALAITKAINRVAGTTNVSATALETIVAINDIDIAEISQLASGDLTINGVEIVGATADVAGLVDTINQFSSSSGVKARVVSGGGGDDIELYAADGRNVDVAIAALNSVSFSLAGDGGGSIQAALRATTNINTVAGSNALWTTAVATQTLTAAGVFSLVGGAAGGIVASTTGLFTGAVELRSANAIILSDDLSTYLGVGSVTSVDNDTAIFSIDISTQEGAQNALGNIDATLSQLNELRSSLGAVQNRLESTIRNISIGLENISAAQSQIRDADIAAETAELTRAQILQQAGIAVLGQANSSAQVALSLLQF